MVPLLDEPRTHGSKVVGIFKSRKLTISNQLHSNLCSQSSIHLEVLDISQCIGTCTVHSRT